MAAIERAIEDGADFVEIDVQETADGAVVVAHDSDFMKLAGVNLKIWDATMADLQEIDVGSWFSPEFKDERVPTLGQVLDELGKDDPMMDLAMELERIALEDEYFIEKKLYPNVDFYSGIIYKALNIPVSMFTVMFAIARTVGWVAQWLEQCETPTKIGRPRQVYAGPTERRYRALHRRR